MSLPARQHASRAIQQCVIQVPNPLQGRSYADGLLHVCNRVELSEACATVAPHPQTDEPVYTHVVGTLATAAPTWRLLCTFTVTMRCIADPIRPRILQQRVRRPIKRCELCICRNLSLAPTLRSNKDAGHVDCVLKRPCEPALAPSSFHTASKLPYLFQNVSSFRIPRDACNLMM